MEKKDLLEFSPVRFFEKATSANLKAGEMGLITAKKGLGKTSILVQFAIDSLLEGNALVHVSFDQKSSNVISWYSSVLAEIAKKRSVNISEMEDEIVRERTILNFNQETFSLPKVVNTLKALKEGGIKITTIVVDGLDMIKVSKEDLDCFANFVKAENMSAWFSYTSEACELKDTLPTQLLDVFTTVAHLASESNTLALSVLKNGNGKVTLDAKTLLMSK